MEQQRELNGEAVEHNEQADEPAVKDNFLDLPMSKILSLDVVESTSTIQQHLSVEKPRAGTGAAQSGDFFGVQVGFSQLLLKRLRV